MPRACALNRSPHSLKLEKKKKKLEKAGMQPQRPKAAKKKKKKRISNKKLKMENPELWHV